VADHRTTTTTTVAAIWTDRDEQLTCQLSSLCGRWLSLLGCNVFGPFEKLAASQILVRQAFGSFSGV
jgi:hypothetical protein